MEIQLQHVNVKLLLKDVQELDLDPIIPVFHSWIQGQVFDELLLDVADYRHVQAGPGVLIIGHEADYSLDNTDNRLGVRYSRKAVTAGTNQERLAQAALAALTAAERIHEDTRLNRKLYFNGTDIEVFVNDRALAPNTEASREALRAEFLTFSQRLFGGGEYSLSFGEDPRRLLSVALRSAHPYTVDDLIANLKAAATGPGRPAPSRESPGNNLGDRLEIAQGAD